MARRARRSRADIARWGQMVEALRLMNMGFNNIRLYPPTHKEVAGAVAQLHATLVPVLEEMDDVGYGFMEEMLYVEGALSLEETAKNQMLVDRFNRCKVKYLTFTKGVTIDELLTFFTIVNAESAKPTTEHPAELLEKKGLAHVHIVEAEVDDTASKSKIARKKTLLDWYVKAVATLQTTLEELRGGAAADLKPLYRVIDDMMATMRSKGAGPFLLVPALARGMDPHVCHGVNVGILCGALGDLAGLNSGQISTLCAAAFLHDAGRLTVPLDWIGRAQGLDAAERKRVRQHADWSFLWLARHDEIPPQIALLGARHHSHLPLKPGPGVYTPDIFHKILAVADSYDLATIGERRYWRQRRRDRILLRLLGRRGGSYDPLVAKLLTDCVGLPPVGSLVQLDDGQRGIVVRANPANPGRPKVYLFEAPPPAAPDEEVPPAILDLADRDDAGTAFRRSVARVLSPPEGFDLAALLDAKKEHLLSHAL